MKQHIASMEKSPLKRLFWFVFIALFIAGVHIIWLEYRATQQTDALIKELKNRVLTYTLQLKTGNEIKSLFPVIAATGNMTEAFFSPLQNKLQITVKGVTPRLCQKIIRSTYTEPIEIVVNGYLIDNRQSDDCPLGTPVDMVFRYEVSPTNINIDRLAQSSETFENALAVATEVTSQPITEAISEVEVRSEMLVEPIVQADTKTTAVPVAQKKSPLRRLARRHILPTETLGDVICAQNKRKKAVINVVRTTLNNHVPDQPHIATGIPATIDEILAQDAATRAETPVSLALDTYQSSALKKHANIHYLPPVAHLEKGHAQTQHYQRPMYDDTTYITRTGLNIFQ